MFQRTGIESPTTGLVDITTKLAGDHAPRMAGTVAGVSHGVAEIPDFANQLLRNHEALLEAVEAFAREASPELLVAMIANMPADVHRMQDEVNPSDSPPSAADGPGEAASICIEQGLDVGASESKYCRYATGFYLGYGAFTAVELASGAKALVKGVRKAGDLAEKIRGATNKLEDVKGAIRQGERSLSATISSRAVTDGGIDNFDGAAFRGGLRDRGIDSTGALVRAERRVTQLHKDGDIPTSLSVDRRVDLGEAVVKHGDSAVRVAKTVDAASLRYILRTDNIGEANDLLNYGLHTSAVRKLADDGQIASEARRLDDNLDSIYQSNSEKFTKAP